MVQNETKQAFIKVLSVTPDYMKAFWIATRNCYFKGTLIELNGDYTPEKGYDLFKKIISLKHHSCLEHINFQISLEGISRSFMAQITRHRHVTFHISSQHYQDHSDYLYVRPKFINPKSDKLFTKIIEDINSAYKQMLEYGEKHYIAREILPNATSCKIIMSLNLRELRHIFKLREGPENTPEMQEVMKLLRMELYKVDSIFLWGLFND